MRVALVGYGRMGRELDRLAPAVGLEVVARLGREDPLDSGHLEGAEVAIEFTRPEVAPGNLVRLAELGVDAVCGTTGWSERHAEVARAVEGAGTGLLHAPNFALGVALFRRIVQGAARLVDALPDYDVALGEEHHRHKVDHPSGTARALADDLLAGLGRKSGWRLAPPEGAADPGTLWISVARRGEVPGTHEVVVDGPDDRLELRHVARGRAGFARGALEAARWVRGRSGVHTLDDFLADRYGFPHPGRPGTLPPPSPR